MKLSEQWLQEWIKQPIEQKKLIEQLTMAGLEVDSVTPVANAFQQVVIGEVIAAEQHPNADRLRVCQVNVGQAENLTIVCGAENVRAGLKVAVAVVGAQLSPEFTIKKAKLRGVESHGMICSAAELGLVEKSNGILELPKEATVGKDFREYLQLNDVSLDLKITPNRGDCLSVLGVAREVTAFNHLKSPQLPIIKLTTHKPAQIAIKVQAVEACPRYLGRMVRDINAQATTPLWMQERLRRSGLRSIHPVVDVMNYVMIEIGLPLHAFDADKLQGDIQVRWAKADETILLLNQQTAKLNPQTLVIADSKQAQAIAGIMGGQDSAVSNTTKNIFIESAFFAAEVIMRSAQHFQLHSDASQRYERGVDYQLQSYALDRATQLIIEIAGGEASETVSAEIKQHLPQHHAILLRAARIERILGIVFKETEVVDILQRLGMQVKTEKNGWQVLPPSYRNDLRTEIDLIEELARLQGYQHIPLHLPSTTIASHLSTETAIKLSQLRQALVARGYQEAICYSFVPEALQQKLDPQHTAKKLLNPLSQEMAVMRTNLWPGLIQAALYNQARQENRIRLFEIGNCFIEEVAGKLQQPNKLAGLIMGSVNPLQWGMPIQTADFFSLKNDVEALLTLTRQADTFSFRKSEHPALHPQYAAALYHQNYCVGYLGALHPQLQKTLELSAPVYLFEIELAALQQSVLPQFHTLSKFPGMRRDLAIIVDQEVSYEQLQKEIVKTASKLLKNVQIFDIYQGEKIAPGKKSVALGLFFQEQERTLTDEEINTQMQSILKGLELALGAVLR